jgi:hypothetical protein
MLCRAILNAAVLPPSSFEHSFLGQHSMRAFSVVAGVCVQAACCTASLIIQQNILFDAVKACCRSAETCLTVQLATETQQATALSSLCWQQPVRPSS